MDSKLRMKSAMMLIHRLFISKLFKKDKEVDLRMLLVFEHI